jgi:hypothetical protein
MAEEKGLLWKAFDAAERAAAPKLESAVRTGTFAQALGLAARMDSAVRHGLESRTRRLWHLVNLPAASDITRLRRQVATLDRELRLLNRRLERTLADQDPSQEERDHADDRSAPGRERPARAQRDAGPRTPGRRAKRPPRA